MKVTVGNCFLCLLFIFNSVGIHSNTIVNNFQHHRCLSLRLSVFIFFCCVKFTFVNFVTAPNNFVFLFSVSCPFSKFHIFFFLLFIAFHLYVKRKCHSAKFIAVVYLSMPFSLSVYFILFFLCFFFYKYFYFSIVALIAFVCLILSHKYLLILFALFGLLVLGFFRLSKLVNFFIFLYGYIYVCTYTQASIHMCF